MSWRAQFTTAWPVVLDKGGISSRGWVARLVQSFSSELPKIAFACGRCRGVSQDRQWWWRSAAHRRSRGL